MIDNPSADCDFNCRYKKITDLLANSQARGSVMLGQLTQMKDYLDTSVVLSTNTDKAYFNGIITNGHESFRVKYEIFAPKILKLVNNIQLYIVNTYGDVNTYLGNNGIRVLPVFAELSASAGYIIDSSNIEV